MKLETVKLSAVLEKYLPKNTKIDFMDIEVEGVELGVLASNNWNKFRPQVLAVEILGQTSLDNCKKQRLAAF